MASCMVTGYDEIENLTPIQQFYNNSVIFITGCTGFLGQLLLEKLLRSCPNVHIYVLIREKKGKPALSRLDAIFGSALFEKLAKQKPKFKRRVEAIIGDCSMKGLGISKEDRELLLDKVNIVFHGAATVRFDEKLKTAVDINIKGTEEVLKMAREIKHLKSFVYVSTLFANCPKSTIEEKFYPAALDYNQLKNLTDSLPEHIGDTITPQLIGDYPNTYAYTKQIAENIVEELGKNLPLGIYRPSAVVSTYKEPVGGWINNVYGPTGYIAGVGIGIIRVGLADLSCKAHLIPADMTINFLIATAWDIASTYKSNEKSYKPTIYNYDSSNDMPIIWKTFMKELVGKGSHIGTTKCIWYVSVTCAKNYYWYRFLDFFLHTIPGALIDMLLLCQGKSTKLLKAYKKINKFAEVLKYFSTRSWIIQDENYRNLCNKMSEDDKELFFCDLRKLNWPEFFQSCIMGIRIYLYNDPLDTLEEGKARFRKFYWLHQIVKFTIIALITIILWSALKYIFLL